LAQAHAFLIDADWKRGATNPSQQFRIGFLFHSRLENRGVGIATNFKLLPAAEWRVSVDFAASWRRVLYMNHFNFGAVVINNTKKTLEHVHVHRQKHKHTHPLSWATRESQNSWLPIDSGLSESLELSQRRQ